MKYVIDTDPGVDDAMALAFAWGAELPVMAITTVFGNTSKDQCTQNALILRSLFHKESIPVYAGSSKPLKKETRLAESHGANGLGNFSGKTMNTSCASGNAQEYLSSIKEPTTLLCLGPLTNIATFIQSNPKNINSIEKIILLGGVFWELGNVSPYAEFNIYNDPDALDVVLKSGISTVIIPADACRSVTVTKEELDTQLKNAIAREHFRKISDVFIEYYQNNPTYGGFSGGVMYDVLVIGYVLKPDFFIIENFSISVDCSDAETRGKTSISSDGSEVQIVRSVDAAALKRSFFAAINNLHV